MTFELNEDTRHSLVAAIAAAEVGHRAELRVHIEAICDGDAQLRARQIFGDLKMHETAEDTGVLLYLSPESKKVAVFAGKGVHQAAGEALWQEAVSRVAQGFRDGDGLAGLEAGIGIIGDAMRRCAPGEDTAGDELPNEVTTS